MNQLHAYLASASLALGLGLGMVVTTPPASAGPEPAADAAALDPAKSMAQNLGAHKGKSVTLHLASGNTIAGKVAAVSDAHVHITSITGKELYEALVRIDAVVGLEVRSAGK